MTGSIQWRELMRQGLEASGFRATLRLYGISLVILGVVAVPAILFLEQPLTVFRLTPLAAMVLVLAQYLAAYADRHRATSAIGAALLLLLLAPLLLLIGLAIRIDSPGPVLFRQRRIGYSGLPFNLSRFRTTLPDPLPGEQALIGGQSGPLFKVRSDPRITRVGRLLRATALDELPLLLNIVKGDLLLVGPRAPFEWEYQARITPAPVSHPGVITRLSALLYLGPDVGVFDAESYRSTSLLWVSVPGRSRMHPPRHPYRIGLHFTVLSTWRAYQLLLNRVSTGRLKRLPGSLSTA